MKWETKEELRSFVDVLLPFSPTHTVLHFFFLSYLVKGVATIEVTEATASVKVSTLA